MGDSDLKTISVSSMSDAELDNFLKENTLSLKKSEIKKIVELIGRDPTLTEIHIFNIQWSEHSSYKSSRAVLKTLPTEAPNVMLGPVEDSGIVELGSYKGEKYGIVVSHESHNHPSQVVPYEGAATGIGGILRDVLCMGATLFATADPLRFGNPSGKHKNRVKYISQEVINGIAGYGNAVGIPNISGDVYCNDSFDDNCLVNVVCLGLVKEKDIIHSYAPKDAVGYDIILVGKATDNSGFGGAAFASVILDEDEKESNRGAVQVPDPFLKNILIRATYAVFDEVRKQNIPVGFKDLGAGGIMCGSSELCSDAGYGAELNLDAVNIGIKDLPGYIIATSETQERFIWIVPPDFTKTVLKIYNSDFELPRVAAGAKAVVIGTVTENKDYKVTHNGKKICDAPVDVITKGIRYDREYKKPASTVTEPKFDEPTDYNKEILKVLSHPNVANKMACIKHYDTNVMGNTIIAAGWADAGLMAPLENSSYGVALKADGNPRYGRIDPYWGAVNAVAESMRNVAAIGATPAALTDCLNFGNPEKPEAFYQFVEAVRGVKDAAEKLHQKGSTYPVPIVSGNVSFYNESKKGTSVDPSPVVACVGIMEDYSKAITMKIKSADSKLLLIGERKDECGGSVFYELHGELGANVPKIDFAREKNMIHAVIDLIDKGLLLACHDISDGGLATTVSEMVLGGETNGSVGATIALDFSELALSKILFSESSGFVMEVTPENADAVKEVCGSYDVGVIDLGTTGGNDLFISKNNIKIAELPVEKLRNSWIRGFTEALK